MPVKSQKGEKRSDTVEATGVDPTAQVTVNMSGLTAVSEVESVDPIVSGTLSAGVFVENVSVSGNTVSIDFVDNAGGAVAESSEVDSVIVTARGY